MARKAAPSSERQCSPAVLLLLLTVVVAEHMASGAAAAVTFTVTDSTDDITTPPPGSFRKAVQDASTLAENTTIKFDPSVASIELQGPIPISGFDGFQLSIDGSLPGGKRVTLDTAGASHYDHEVSGLGFKVSISSLVLKGQGFVLMQQPDAALTLSNCLFSGVGKDPGKAVFLFYGPSHLTVDGCQFEDHAGVSNSVNQDPNGGTIHASGSGNITITNTAIVRSSVVDGTGGAIALIENVKVFIDNSQFINNTSPTFDGAITAVYNEEMLVQGSLFEGNEATQEYGGAMSAYLLDRPLRLEGCTFRRNRAAMGAALAFQECYGTTEVVNCLLEENAFTPGSSSRAGTVLTFANVASLVVKGSTLLRNEGGLFLAAPPSYAEVIQSTFDSNSHSNQSIVSGWGSQITAKAGTSATVVSSTFVSASAPSGGAAAKAASSRTSEAFLGFYSSLHPSGGGGYLLLPEANLMTPTLTVYERLAKAAERREAAVQKLLGNRRGSLPFYKPAAAAGGASSGGSKILASAATAPAAFVVQAGGALVASYSNVSFVNSLFSCGVEKCISDAAGKVSVRRSVLKGGWGGASDENVASDTPMLGLLQDNGGRTPTRMPLPSSPAVDAGDGAQAAGLTVDQIGAARVVCGAVDIGSVEVPDSPKALASAISFIASRATPLRVPSPGLFWAAGSPIPTFSGAVSIEMASPPSAGGTVQVDPETGTFTYTPEQYFVGRDTFKIRAVSRCSNSTPPSSPVTVTVDVAFKNTAPIVRSPSYTNPKNQVMTIPAPGLLEGASDAENDTLQVVGHGDPAHGTIVSWGSDGSLVYQPAKDFNGQDSFTFNVTDGAGGSAQGTVTITTFNSPPLVVNHSYSIVEDQNLTIPAPGVLEGASDADNDTLQVVGHGDPAHGTIVSWGSDGSLVYQPAKDFNGQDSFTFNVTDGAGVFVQGTVNVTIGPVNDPPAIINHSFSIVEDQNLTIPAPGVLKGASDAENGTLQVVGHSDPAHGTIVSWASDGSLVYQPAKDFNGQDSFTFNVTDGARGSAQGTVTISIGSQNDPPMVLAPKGVRSYTTGINTPLVVPVLGFHPANPQSGRSSPAPAAAGSALFSDPEGDNMTVVIVGPVDTSAGSLSLDRVSGAVTFFPAFKFAGGASFVVRAMDIPGGRESGTVTVNVTVEGKPSLEKPSVNELLLRVGVSDDCKITSTRVQSFNITPGFLAVVGGPTGALRGLGAPGGMIVEVGPLDKNWTSDGGEGAAPKAPSKCQISVPARLNGGQSRALKYPVCGRCSRCLNSDDIKFACGKQYKLRAKARASSGALYTAGEWSDDYVFTPACENVPAGCS